MLSQRLAVFLPGSALALEAAVDSAHLLQPRLDAGLFFAKSPRAQPTARLRFDSVGLPPMPELCAVPSEYVRGAFSNVHPP